MIKHKLLSIVLSEILRHAQSNGFSPSLYPLVNFDVLEKELCSSQLIEWQYISNINQYQFTLKPCEKIDHYAIHDFIMKKNDNHSDNISLMIERDIWEGESTIYVTISVPFDRYLPFVTELLDSNGQFLISYINNETENIIMKQEMIIDTNEWLGIIIDYTGQCDVKMVNVE